MIERLQINSSTNSIANQDKVSDAEKKAAKDFEAIFLKQIMMSQKSDIDSEEMKQFKEMNLTETTKSMAESGGIGLADLMIQQWRKGR